MTQYWLVIINVSILLSLLLLLLLLIRIDENLVEIFGYEHFVFILWADVADLLNCFWHNSMYVVADNLSDTASENHLLALIFKSVCIHALLTNKNAAAFQLGTLKV